MPSVSQRTYRPSPAARKRKNEQQRLKRQREGRIRTDSLRARYNITPEDYDWMLQVQGGGCAVCYTTDASRWGQFHVDHDHETGVVRGLLCAKCNFALGWYERVILPNLKRIEEYRCLR